MKIFKGKKTPDGCIVELDNEGYTTQLSLEKSLQVVDHSPDGYQCGYSGSGTAQLAAAILNEVTDDPELTRTYYQLFKFDHVAKWEGLTFEISEDEVLTWLRAILSDLIDCCLTSCFNVCCLQTRSYTDSTGVLRLLATRGDG